MSNHTGCEKRAETRCAGFVRFRGRVPSVHARMTSFASPLRKKERAFLHCMSERPCSPAFTILQSFLKIKCNFSFGRNFDKFYKKFCDKTLCLFNSPIHSKILFPASSYHKNIQFCREILTHYSTKIHRQLKNHSIFRILHM